MWTLYVLGSAFGLFTLTHAASISLATPLDSDFNAEQWIDQSLEALGGEKALRDLKGVTYHAPTIYRTKSLMQSYTLNSADTYVSISGSQNISYSFTSSEIQQRIDRSFFRSKYWYFTNPTTIPLTPSLIVRGGQDGYACWVKGNNFVFFPPDYSVGYTDAGLAECLEYQGTMLTPQLLLKMKASNRTTTSTITLESGVQMPAVPNADLDMTVIFNDTTHLPLPEPLHRAASDLSGPIQNIYDGHSVLADYLIECITANPPFPTDFFAGLPLDESQSPPIAPEKLAGYTHAEIGEEYQNGLWSGPSELTVANLTAKRPLEDVPGLFHISFEENGYAQLVVEFEESVTVLDAPDGQAEIVIQWVKERIGKPIGWVRPSHPHHHHYMGVGRYVKEDAGVIVPEIAVQYWSHIPGVSFEVVREDKPFILSGSHTQARFLWSPGAVHSEDWGYAIVTSACPSSDTGITAFVADAWSPNTDAIKFDMGDSRRWLNQARGDGLARKTLVTPAHGDVTPLEILIGVAGYAYPELKTTDWKAGGALGGICKNYEGH